MGRSATRNRAAVTSAAYDHAMLRWIENPTAATERDAIAAAITLHLALIGA